MLIDEFTKIFLKIEKDNNLFNLKSDNENFWNYIRYSLYEEIAFKNKTNERIEFSNFRLKTILKQSLDLAKNYFIPLFKTTRLSKNTDIAIFNYSIYLKENGNYINQLSYNLSKMLENNFNIEVLDNFGMTKKLSGYKSQIIDTRPIFIRSKLISSLIKNKESEVKAINMMQKIILKNFNYKISSKKYLKKLRFSRIYLNAMKTFFKDSKLKIVMFSNNGSMSEIIRAAKYHKIKTIDFQHSIISPYNILYNYPKKEGEKYTEDFLITWGDKWSDNFSVNSKVLSLGSIAKFNFPILKKTEKIYNKKIIIIGSKKDRELLSSIAINLSRELVDHVIYYKCVEYFDILT